MMATEVVVTTEIVVEVVVATKAVAVVTGAEVISLVGVVVSPAAAVGASWAAESPEEAEVLPRPLSA